MYLLAAAQHYHSNTSIVVFIIIIILWIPYALYINVTICGVCTAPPKINIAWIQRLSSISIISEMGASGWSWRRFPGSKFELDNISCSYSLFLCTVSSQYKLLANTQTHKRFAKISERLKEKTFKRPLHSGDIKSLNLLCSTALTCVVWLIKNQ